MNIVELRIEQSHSSTMETYSCSFDFWNLMLSVGEAFGWKPLGTSYLPTSFKSVQGQQTPRHDYRPGEWSDAKRVGAEDASAWAAALRVALDSSHLDSMLTPYHGIANQAHTDLDADPYQDGTDIRDSLNDFAKLLQQGALLFAVADAIDAEPDRGIDSQRDAESEDHASWPVSPASNESRL